MATTTDRWIDQVGQFGLLVFSVGLMTGAALLSAGQVLMGLAFVLWLPRMWRPLLRDRLFVLSLVFYAYVLGYLWVLEVPAAVSVPLRGGNIDTFFKTGFLNALVAAFWWARLRDAGRFSWPVWGFVLAFHLRLLMKWPLEDWSQGIPWKLGFGLYYNPFGMFCALVLAWWLVLLASAGRRNDPRGVAVIVLASLIPLLGLVYSASRGAVVAFFAALLVMAWLWLRENAGGFLSWKRLSVAVLVGAALGVLIASGPVAKRDPQAKGEIGRMLEQGIAQYVPERASSIGTRVVIWREGMKLWLEKPFLGHGPRPTEEFLTAMKQEYRLGDSFDFENTYLELLVRLGLVGAALFAFHLGLCVHSYRRGTRAGWYPRVPGRFLLLAAVIFGTALLFREGLLDLRGRHFATFLLAGLYSFQAATLWGGRRDGEPDEA